MIERISKLGRTKTVIIVTAFSTIFSLLITAIAMIIVNANEKMAFISYIIATLVPLIVAPIVAFVLVTALLKLHELEQEMRELASVDYLTKLLSRRAWITQTDKYIRLAMRNKSNYSILMIDLDDFKEINDRFGHLAGDKVLVEFGKTVNELCRSSDFAARFGGEEFIILLPDTTPQQAQQFTDRLHNAINNMVVVHDNDTINLTISIGLSVQATDELCTIDMLISQSDQALYQAKQQGKNCTCTFRPHLA